jgi:peptidoglycan/LPS O-acetylase OafA/YrhL
VAGLRRLGERLWRSLGWSLFGSEGRRAALGERPGLEQHRRFGYRPELDGVRALAILPVVGFHAYVVPKGGYLGVDIFFVLSGFLITTLLVEEGLANGRISLGHFYFRRALRLLPALFVAAFAYVLLSSVEVAVSGHTHAGTPLSSALIGSLYGVLYVQNILIATGTAMPLAVGHLWSLATEEQFYLLWPLVLVFALRAKVSVRALSIGLIGLIVVLNLDRLYLLTTSAPFRRVYFAPDGHFDVILIGCLAGLWFTRGNATKALSQPLARRVFWAVGVGTVAVMLTLPYYATWRTVLGLLPLLAFGIAALILAAATNDSSPVGLLLSLPPLVFIGKISYALYLWHPIIIWGFHRLPVTAEVALAIGIATLSYYFVELPFLRLKRRDRARIDAESTHSKPDLVAPGPAG